MSGMEVPINAESAQIDAVVIRCGCGNPASHAGQVCPMGIPVELGTIAYFHRNPLRRLAWELKQAIQNFVDQSTKEQ